MGTAFTACYAVALLFHNQKSYVTRDAVGMGLTVSALACVIRPDLAPLLILACLIQMVQFWRRLPTAQPSEYLKALCGVCVVLTYVPLAIRFRTLAVSAQILYDGYAPLLRLLVCMMLLASVLHKINWAFLRHDTSTAPRFLEIVFEQLGLRPGPRAEALLATVMPLMTLAIETGAALLLVYPPTRSLGIFVVFGFWTMIAAQHVTQFASLMFALMIPFLRADVFGVLDPAAAFAALQAACVAYFVYAIYAANLIASPATLLTLMGISGAVYLLDLIAAGRPITIQGPIAPLSAGPALLIGAYWLNELGPYIGFKDFPAFRMYSCLETGPRHNHVFIPRWLYVEGFRPSLLILTRATLDTFYHASRVPYQTAMITSPEIRRPDDQFSMPLADLRALAASTMRFQRALADTPIEYHDGAAIVTSTIRDLATTGHCFWRPVWLVRFFVFRPRRHQPPTDRMSE